MRLRRWGWLLLRVHRHVGWPDCVLIFEGDELSCWGVGEFYFLEGGEGVGSRGVGLVWGLCDG